MDIKLGFGIASVVALVIAYFPYFRDIFRKTTKPHAYTWLIWAITQGTATAAAFYGGANWGVLSLAGGTILVIFVFLLSFKYGTKNISRSDTGILLLALFAIVVWWLTNNPLLSVLMVTAIDGMGYIPTLRKSWEEPWSETLAFWFTMAIVNVLTILSLGEINWLTAPYLVVLASLNIVVLSICMFRRRLISKPVTETSH
ncbi:MAG: hypothetical protein HY482_00325 [Candidatus Wildermuthbacteria bacterium]|nr:hypothetical protein [Candidatus Wildermuthbacteria bacterium]